jgi:hypothetical protein
MGPGHQSAGRQWLNSSCIAAAPGAHHPQASPRSVWSPCFSLHAQAAKSRTARRSCYRRPLENLVERREDKERKECRADEAEPSRVKRAACPIPRQTTELAQTVYIL